MKKLKIFLVLILMMVPTFVNAEDKFNLVLEDEVTSEKVIEGSSLILGNNVTSDNTVNGIDMLLGNNVNYKSDSDYALILGNNVNVYGNVKNDGFVLGNIVTFDSTFEINRDLIIFANTVILRGKINRDITVYASSVVLEDVVIIGDASLSATNLEIKKNVEINGTLSYNEDAVTIIDESALIANTNLSAAIQKEVTLKEKVYNFLIDYAGTLVIFLVLALIVPKLFERIESKYKESKAFDIFSSIGFGALLLVFIPIVFILLLSFVFGVSLAILLLVIYILSIWLSSIFTGYLIGLVIYKKIIKKDLNILLVGLVGISTYCLLQIVPFIGFYVTLLGMMLGLGIIFKLFKKD